MKIKLLSNCLVFLVSFFLPYISHAQADLAVIQTVVTQVSPNRNLTYSILVVNNGPGSALDISLRDTLSFGTTFVSFTAPAGWNATTPVVGSNSPILATIPTVPSGAIQAFTLVVNVGSSVPIGPALINRVSISSSSPDPNLTNNLFIAGTAVVGILPRLDLVVTKRGLSTLNFDGNAVYTIQVANIGLEPQTSVSLADILPSGTTFLSLTAPIGWTVTTPPVGSNGIVIASIPTLLPGEVAAFALVAKIGPNVPVGTSVLNVASVTSASADLTPFNNLFTATTRIVSPLPSDVSVIKTGPATVSAGSNITYTITVKNSGPNDAQNVSLSDALPPFLTFVSLLAAPGWGISTPPTGSSGVITASIPLLVNGSSATFTLVVKLAEKLT